MNILTFNNMKDRVDKKGERLKDVGMLIWVIWQEERCAE